GSGSGKGSSWRLGNEGDGALVDPVSFHGGDLEQQAIVADRIANCRRPAEQREDDSADAVDVLVLEVEIELLPELVDAHRSGDVQPSHGVPVDLRRADGPFV